MAQPVPEKAKVVVIGSGAGGGSIAYWLAKRGVQTVLLEKGVWRDERPKGDSCDNDELNQYKPRKTPGDDDLDFSDVQLNGDAERVPDKLGHGFGLVGGATPVYAATAWRFREADFLKEKTFGKQLGRLLKTHYASAGRKVDMPDWGEGYYEEMGKYYPIAEDLVGVSGDDANDPTKPYAGQARKYMPPLELHRVNELLKAAALELNWHPFPVPMAINSVKRPREGDANALVSDQPCVSCNYCSGFNCVHRAKNGVDSALLAPLRGDPNLTVITDATARRLERAAAADGAVRCTGVRFTRGKEREARLISADVVVLAAGALQSPRLLWLSDMPLDWKEVAGHYLTFHIDHKLEAIFPKHAKDFAFRMVKKLAVMDHYLPDPAGKGHLFTNHCSIQTGNKPHPGTEARKSKGWGEEFLKEFHEDYMRTYEVQTIAEDLSVHDNRVEFDKTFGKDEWDDPRAKVTHQFHPMDLAAANSILGKMVELAEAAGVRVIGKKRVELKDLKPSGSHIMGTLRMGDDPARSVVDREGRLRKTENLFVVDASIFTTSAGLNPGLTLEANAFRVGDILLEKYLQ